MTNFERATYTSLTEIFGQVISYGFLTTQARLQLKEILLQDSITEVDLLIANRILYALRHNILKLAD